jgi:hypothetical protein
VQLIECDRFNCLGPLAQPLQLLAMEVLGMLARYLDHPLDRARIDIANISGGFDRTPVPQAFNDAQDSLFR